MQISSHAAEWCPDHEPKYRAITINWFNKVEPLAAKYGIKFLGSYTDHPMHEVYVLFDTPSMDVLMKFMMEPEMAVMMNFCKSRVFPVFDHKSTLALISK